jgi:hypothetical protein
MRVPCGGIACMPKRFRFVTPVKTFEFGELDE